MNQPAPASPISLRTSKPAPPSLESLINMVRSSVSPLEREHAVRAAYLMGGVHALDGKANATYDAVPESGHCQHLNSEFLADLNPGNGYERERRQCTGCGIEFNVMTTRRVKS